MEDTKILFMISETKIIASIDVYVNIFNILFQLFYIRLLLV
jgi:hypothetical protein